MSRRSTGNKKRTEFQNLTTAELARRAKDKARPKSEQREAQQELKARKRRNKQKRRSS